PTLLGGRDASVVELDSQGGDGLIAAATGCSLALLAQNETDSGGEGSVKGSLGTCDRRRDRGVIPVDGEVGRLAVNVGIVPS
ncbi:MAG: hypothetical protein ACRDZ8_05795, partial [Acidimicrobiales bacterium]